MGALQSWPHHWEVFLRLFAFAGLILLSRICSATLRVTQPFLICYIGQIQDFYRFFARWGEIRT
jgi:hypothetical protein